MAPDAACDLFDRLKSTSHSPLDPAFQETTRPRGRNVFPPQRKALLEKIAAYALEVVLEKIGKFDQLFFGQVFFSLQKKPSTSLEHRFVSLLRHLPGLGGTDFVQGFVPPSHNMKTIQNVYRLRSLLGDHFQIRLPHVAADELDGRRPFATQCLKEPRQRLGRTILANPQQASAASIDLIYTHHD